MAKPFITYHNELDMNLYMRIAPELYHKVIKKKMPVPLEQNARKPLARQVQSEIRERERVEQPGE